MSDNVTASVQPGERFGHLVTLKRHKRRGGASWSCWCRCGRLVFVPEYLLIRERKSCTKCSKSDRV